MTLNNNLKLAENAVLSVEESLSKVFQERSNQVFQKLENILIIGNGGRENSLAWVIQKNELVKKVYLSPGNAGSDRINKCERIVIDINYKNLLVENLNFLKIDLNQVFPCFH